MKRTVCVTGLVGLAGLVLAVGGCLERNNTVVAQPQPVYVDQPQPVYVAQPQPIYVPEPPPPQPVVEVIPVQPGPGYYYIQGYHHWDGHRWVVEHGRWEKPQPNHVWVGPVYERGDHGTKYVPGHWQEQHHDHH